MEEEIKSLKRKLKISFWINSLLVLIAFMFFIYAFIQRAEAVRQKELANDFILQAQRSAAEAIVQREIAEQERQMAEAQKADAEEFAKRTAEAMKKK